MKKSITTALVLALCACLFLLSGCGGASTSESSTPGTSASPSTEPSTEPSTTSPDEVVDNRELRIAGREIAVGLNPTVPIVADYLVNMGAGELLFKANAGGIIEPSLAAGVEEIDPTTWEIKLRPEACFWSGKPVDADAVIDSLEHSRETDLKAQPFLEGMSFSKLDDYTIQVKTTLEHLTVPLNLSYLQLVIHNVEPPYTYEDLNTIDFTGMYKIVEFVPKQRMVFEVNNEYWGQKPTIERIIQEEIGDEQTRTLAALSGRYHVVMNIPASSMAQFAGSNVAQISAVPPANTETIYLNLNQPQLQDYRVRQALSWGLDRDELNLLGAEGQSTPVTTWLGSNPAFSEAKNTFFKYDFDKASALLDEAGWTLGGDGIRYKDGMPLTLRLMTWGVDKALGEALQNQWSKLGIQATVQHGDYGLIETARGTGDWDAFIEAWGTFGNTASLLKGQYSPAGGANYGGYDDEETNQLLDSLSSASDETERHELAILIIERVAKQSPVICVYPRPELTAVSTSLDGFTPHFRQFENVINSNLRIVD